MTGPPNITVYPNARKIDLTKKDDVLVCCDCLELLEKLDDETIDLIYIDPPFCTQARRANRRTNAAYHDHWPGGVEQYLAFLKPRLTQMHRVLKNTGSMFVHLDYRTVHYVKIELDRIFGHQQFTNEIIWSYRTGGVSQQWFARKHQTILAYAKRIGQQTFHVLRNGTFRTDGLNFDNQGRPYKSTRKGRLYFDQRGPALTDVWDIPFLSTVGNERTGYPDQKPLKLIERIITACSSPGDRVADFFTGSGTTPLAARRLGRQVLACDISSHAIKLTHKRLTT